MAAAGHISMERLCFFFQVHDIFYQLTQTSDEEFSFIWINESKMGFSHLYKITSLLQPGCCKWTDDYQHTEGKDPPPGTFI